MPRFKVTIRKPTTIWEYRDITVTAEDREDAENLALNADHYSNADEIEDDSDWYEGRSEDYGPSEVWDSECIDHKEGPRD